MCMDNQSIGIKLLFLTLLVLSPAVYFNFIYDRDVGYESLRAQVSALTVKKIETKELSSEEAGIDEVNIIDTQNQS